ncbi:hypothetical protein [Thaumasiovibrio subtropicus]|uniref:hypothetical protein n=1 Tax=Thaumasiovibrio subtropicus TaxID=1891207 RepID=UPI000B36264B|nr:hypothetical protein [Thaumasiovibrio subtropicus]
MISQNFSWSSSIHLKHESIEYDLHNDFDFKEYSYSIETKSVNLIWKRGVGSWVNKNQPEYIILTINGVFQAEVRPRDSDMSFTEDNCLSSFGFIANENWCDGQFWTECDPDEEWLWSFYFQSGAEIVLGAKSATVQIVL